MLAEVARKPTGMKRRLAHMLATLVVNSLYEVLQMSGKGIGYAFSYLGTDTQTTRLGLERACLSAQMLLHVASTDTRNRVRTSACAIGNSLHVHMPSSLVARATSNRNSVNQAHSSRTDVSLT